jgi:excisionase family DNA binding protein
LSPGRKKSRGQNRLNAGGAGRGQERLNDVGADKAGERFLTVVEVAQVLALSTASVYKLVQRGVLIHVRMLNTVRIPFRAVSGLVKDRSARPRRNR